MITESLLDESHEMIQRIAPEIERLYLFGRPADWPAPAVAHGFAVTARDHQLEAHLRNTNQWSGPGSIVVLDLDRISEDVKGRDIRPALLELSIHEAGHLVPYRAVGKDAPSTPAEVVADVALNRVLAALPETQGLPPWSGDHTGPFIRRVIHLCIRAWTLGYQFPGYRLAAGEHYGLSPLSAYAYALGDEPGRMAGCSFAEIERTPPPTSFSALWERDICEWEKREAAA